ncbi:uncharacterized protein [Leptinotarsa decemlineata]|uniref:uncharacterized protein n=1 Tax=Leptinotarsa decemlineata TaxID=7539 RepID=UPI003D30ADF6
MDDEKSAIEIAKQVAYIHSQANFEIRNWHSNSQILMKTMNRSSQSPEEIDMNMDSEATTEKVLGMWWNLNTDCLVFSLKYNKGNKEVLQGKKRPTKREILRIMMSIYDPLGLISNFLVYLKILLQEIWRSKITWDDPITDSQFSKWLTWLNYLPEIEKLSISRCYIDNFLMWETCNVQLHIFVDASESASAVAAYLRIFNEDKEDTKCSLVGSKTRVAPIKLQTMPRLELDGALMGARFAKTIKSHLSIDIHETIYWSDSKIVLCWIRSEDTRKLCKFVAHRVAEIQDISMISNWHYVPTKLNVADEATKWTKRPSLKATDRWFVGPEFLYSKRQLWPMEEPDEKQCAQQTVSIHETQTFLLNITNFSSYNKLLYTVGYVHKFVNLMRKTYQARTTGILNSEELKQAENTLIRIVQKEFYHEEIKTLKNSSTTKLQPTVKSTSKIYKLSPYLDEYGILRVRGRIDVSNRIEVNAKRPIILPRESHLTTLIIRKYHITFQHKNHESVFNEIRQKYYIPKLRRTLNKVRKNCQTCIINSAVPAIPEMSPLPVCRLATFISPFTHTGVDYFGPMNVMIGRRTEKRWGALFTCLTTRAVHIEVAHKLDHDNCILCFKNFMNRRGTPRHIYCDRGTNFVATERVLREELQKLKTKMIAESFISPELSFHFNPPLSPHMGGAWERLVKSIKIALYDALPTRNPTDPLLRSCLIAAENIVNSRPLTYLPLDSEESEALTPNHFLVGSSNGDKPIVDLDVNAKILKFRIHTRPIATIKMV